MTAIDSSVCVPALLTWHEAHDVCRPIAAGANIPSHALVESFSVLTRLPAPHRLDGRVAADLLAERFPPDRILINPPTLQRSVVARAIDVGVQGGGVYDALIGLIARHHGERLHTRDRRAAPTYEALGVDFEIVGAAPSP